MKKYELTKTKISGDEGVTLYRVQALKSFSNVREGDVGGFVESEDNLSQDGDAWVGGNAMIFEGARVLDSAKVCGNARVCGEAQVYGNAWVSVGNIERPVIVVSGLRWTVTIMPEHMRIGCQVHSIDRWDSFSEHDIDMMDEDALSFWKKYKSVLMSLARSQGGDI